MVDRRGWKRFRPTPRAVLVARIVLIVPALVLTCIFGFTHQSATFTLDAKTEQLTVTLRPEDPKPLWGRPAAAYVDRAGKLHRCLQPQAYFEDRRPSDVTLTFFPEAASSGGGRVGSHATESFGGIRVEAASLKPGFAGLQCDGHLITDLLSFRMVLRAKDGNISLPFEGNARVGGDLPNRIEGTRTHAARLLREGKLRMDATPLPFTSERARSESELSLGDALVFKTGVKASVPATSIGMVRVDGDALRVLLRSQADRAEVELRGGSTPSRPVVYEPNLSTRLQSAGTWAALVIVYGLAMSLLSGVSDYLNAVKANSRERT